MIELRGYIDEHGNKRFAQWLEGLNAAAAARVTIALACMEQGNPSKAKSVGVKERQQQDTAAANECWAMYERRKKQEIQ